MCWKWKNQQQSPPSHFGITLNLFSIIGQTSPRARNGRISSKVLLPTFGSPSIFFSNPSNLPLMVCFFHFLLFSLLIFFLNQRDSSIPKKKKTSQPPYLPFQNVGSLTFTCCPIHLSKTICSLSTAPHFFSFLMCWKFPFQNRVFLLHNSAFFSRWLHRHGKTTHQPEHDPPFRLYTCWIFFFKGSCIPSRVNSTLRALMQNKIK